MSMGRSSDHKGAYCKDSLVTTQNNVQTHVNNTVVDSSGLVQQSTG